MFVSNLQGEPGDNMGALLRGIKREQVRRGQVIIATGSMKAVTKFQAQVYLRICQPVSGVCVLSNLCRSLQKTKVLYLLWLRAQPNV